MVEQQGIVWDGQVEAHASMCCCVVLAVATAPAAEQEDSGLGLAHTQKGDNWLASKDVLGYRGKELERNLQDLGCG